MWGLSLPSPPEYGIRVSTRLRESIFPAAQFAWTPHVFLISNGCGRKRAMTDALTNVKKKLQDEITTLEHEMNVDLPRELMKARAHGDLSENAEYKYAKERQGYVSARLGQLKKRLGALGEVRANEFALRFVMAPFEMTIFPDGRAIIKGTTDPGVARSLYARYVGN